MGTLGNTTAISLDVLNKVNAAGGLQENGQDLSAKYQAKLAAQTAYSAKGTATKVPQITTNTLGQVTGITEVTISGVTPASHAHGDITNAGAITGTTALGNGDGLIFADSSDSSKLKRSSIAIGTGTTKYLREDGTWQTPPNTTYSAGEGLYLDGTTFSTVKTSKTYDNVKASSNDNAGGRKSFMNIIPTSSSTTWYVRYSIEVQQATTGGNAAYIGYYLCEWSGCNQSIMSYRMYNNFNSSYTMFYSHDIAIAKTANITTDGHYIGIRLNDASNPTTVARKLIVRVYETRNCTVALESAVIVNPYYVSGQAKFYTNSTVNATSEGLQESGDSDSTACYLYKSYGRIKAGPNGIKNNSLFWQLEDGTWESLTTTSGTSATHARNSKGFRVGAQLFWNSSSDIAANGTIDSLYWQYHSIDLRYTFNLASTTSLVAYKDIYLVGKIRNGLFYIESDGTSYDGPKYVQELPTNYDGKYYMFLGRAYNSSNDYRLGLYPTHPIYYCRDSHIYTLGDTTDSLRIASESLVRTDGTLDISSRIIVDDDGNNLCGDDAHGYSFIGCWDSYYYFLHYDVGSNTWSYDNNSRITCSSAEDQWATDVKMFFTGSEFIRFYEWLDNDSIQYYFKADRSIDGKVFTSISSTGWSVGQSVNIKNIEYADHKIFILYEDVMESKYRIAWLDLSNDSFHDNVTYHEHSSMRILGSLLQIKDDKCYARIWDCDWDWVYLREASLNIETGQLINSFSVAQTNVYEYQIMYGTSYFVANDNKICWSYYSTDSVDGGYGVSISEDGINWITIARSYQVPAASQPEPVGCGNIFIYGRYSEYEDSQIFYIGDDNQEHVLTIPGGDLYLAPARKNIFHINNKYFLGLVDETQSWCSWFEANERDLAGSLKKFRMIDDDVSFFPILSIGKDSSALILKDGNGSCYITGFEAGLLQGSISKNKEVATAIQKYINIDASQLVSGKLSTNRIPDLPQYVKYENGTNSVIIKSSQLTSFRDSSRQASLYTTASEVGVRLYKTTPYYTSLISNTKEASASTNTVTLPSKTGTLPIKDEVIEISESSTLSLTASADFSDIPASSITDGSWKVVRVGNYGYFGCLRFVQNQSNVIRYSTNGSSWTNVSISGNSYSYLGGRYSQIYDIAANDRYVYILVSYKGSSTTSNPISYIYYMDMMNPSVYISNRITLSGYSTTYQNTYDWAGNLYYRKEDGYVYCIQGGATSSSANTLKGFKLKGTSATSAFTFSTTSTMCPIPRSKIASGYLPQVSSGFTPDEIEDLKNGETFAFTEDGYVGYNAHNRSGTSWTGSYFRFAHLDSLFSSSSFNSGQYSGTIGNVKATSKIFLFKYMYYYYDEYEGSYTYNEIHACNPASVNSTATSSLVWNPLKWANIHSMGDMIAYFTEGSSASQYSLMIAPGSGSSFNTIKVNYSGMIGVDGVMGGTKIGDWYYMLYYDGDIDVYRLRSSRDLKNWVEDYSWAPITAGSSGSPRMVNATLTALGDKLFVLIPGSTSGMLFQAKGYIASNKGAEIPVATLKSAMQNIGQLDVRSPVCFTMPEFEISSLKPGESWVSGTDTLFPRILFNKADDISIGFYNKDQSSLTVTPKTGIRINQYGVHIYDENVEIPLPLKAYVHILQTKSSSSGTAHTAAYVGSSRYMNATITLINTSASKISSLTYTDKNWGKVVSIQGIIGTSSSGSGGIVNGFSVSHSSSTATSTSSPTIYYITSTTGTQSSAVISSTIYVNEVGYPTEISI